MDANIEKYNEDEDSFWNLYKDANITFFASHTYNDEQKEKEDNEVENEFFVPCDYPRETCNKVPRESSCQEPKE